VLGGPATQLAVILGGLIGAGAALGSVFGAAYAVLRTGFRGPASEYVEAAAGVAIVGSFGLPILALLEEAALT
jgi:hypothetical protein